MSRPPDLPEFRKPPLNEVVLGVQFDIPPGYQQIRAGEVWKIYSSEFPKVQELSPLPPTFETFGPQVSIAGFGPVPGATFMSVGHVIGLVDSRFWFLSETGNEVIQFQSDRLLHNWRKVAGHDNPYPRYEYIVSKFSSELHGLEAYMSGLSQQSLRIRQCEISYVNHIRPRSPGDLRVGDWLNFLSFPFEPDDFATSFRRIIRSADGQPQGRVTCESATAVEPTGQRFIALTLTARGAPAEPSLQSALEFIARGREVIVRTFTEITTDLAHQVWERTT